MIDLRAGVTNESTPCTTPTAVVYTNTRREEEVERSDRPVTYSDQLKSHAKLMHDILYWGTATDWYHRKLNIIFSIRLLQVGKYEKESRVQFPNVGRSGLMVNFSLQKLTCKHLPCLFRQAKANVHRTAQKYCHECNN